MKKTFEIFTKFFALAICACAFHTPGVAATSDIVNNKTSKFNETLADITAKSTDTSTDARADSIRRQRALLDNAGKQDATQNAPKTSSATKCDNALRKCMAEKCGSDFTKCAKDSTAIWGDKMDSCRRKTECTAREYTLLAPEILADRDTNERMSHYNSVITCGKNYNSCIFAECGTTLDKCLAKSDGDRAISKCESVARTCRSQDSGLAARAMTVFGDMRTVATTQAAKDEARLRELRDLMRTQCNRFGAMFDERTLDCVYTVNFFAGDDTATPKASKKLYAGDSFQCNANWFGVDVTTFKENAYRRTRAQTSASSAAMGAGVGTAVGLVTSGAVGRALETQKAKKEMDKEQAAADKAACEAQDGKTWDGKKCVDATGTPVSTETPIETNNKSGNTMLDKVKNAVEKAGAGTSVQNIAECITYATEAECKKHSDKCKWATLGNSTDPRCIANTQADTPKSTKPSNEKNNNEPVSSSCPQIGDKCSSENCPNNSGEITKSIAKPLDKKDASYAPGSVCDTTCECTSTDATNPQKTPSQELNTSNATYSTQVNLIARTPEDCAKIIGTAVSRPGHRNETGTIINTEWRKYQNKDEYYCAHFYSWNEEPEKTNRQSTNPAQNTNSGNGAPTNTVSTSSSNTTTPNPDPCARYIGMSCRKTECTTDGHITSSVYTLTETDGGKRYYCNKICDCK